MVEGGGFWTSVLIGAVVGAVVGAVGAVAIAASCGTLAPVVITVAKVTVTVSAKVVIGADGVLGGGAGGAIKDALNYCEWVQAIFAHLKTIYYFMACGRVTKAEST